MISSSRQHRMCFRGPFFQPLFQNIYLKILSWKTLWYFFSNIFFFAWPWKRGKRKKRQIHWVQVRFIWPSPTRSPDYERVQTLTAVLLDSFLLIPPIGRGGQDIETGKRRCCQIFPNIRLFLSIIYCCFYSLQVITTKLRKRRTKRR